MRENIILQPGDRVRQDGKSYKVADASTVTGELIEIVAQKNQHLAFACQQDACATYQKEHHRRGTLLVFRTTKGPVDHVCQGALPACALCGVPMSWIVEEGE